MLRREFIALLPAGASAAQSQRRSANEELKDLLAGNRRFVTGPTLNPRQSPADFSKLASGQMPNAVNPTIRSYVEAKRLKVAGAVYDLASGEVTVMV
jgi:carbonic anhydrase